MIPPVPPPGAPRPRRRTARWLLPLAVATVAAAPSGAQAIERGTIDVTVEGAGRVTDPHHRTIARAGAIALALRGLLLPLPG